MKKTSVIIGSLLFVALFAGSVMAYGPGMGGWGGGFCRSGGGQSGAGGWTNLSKEQQDQVSALHQKYVDDTYAVRSAMHQKRQEVRMLMETSAPDRAKLSSLSNEILDLEKQLREKQIDFQLSAKKIAPESALGMGYGKGWGRGSYGNRGGGYGDCPRFQGEEAPVNN